MRDGFSIPFYLVLLITCSFLSMAASEFSFILNGPGPERFVEAAPLDSGGYIALGMRSSAYGERSDLLLVELSSNGDSIRTTYAGGPWDDIPAGLIVDPDDGFWIGSTSYSGDPDSGTVGLLRLDQAHDTLWCTHLPGPRRVTDITLLENGNCLLAGSAGPPASEMGMAALFTPAGDTLWTATYQSVNSSVINSAAPAGNGAALCGSVEYADATDGWFLLIDGDGGLISETTPGPEGGTSLTGILSASGGFAMAGWADAQTEAVSDMYLAMVDTAGMLMWDTSFGGPGWDRALGLCEAGDGYLLVGASSSFASGEMNRSDLYMVRTDALGNLLWERTHGTGKPDYGWSAAQCSDGGFILGGSVTAFEGQTHYDAWALRTDSLGQVPQQGIESESGELRFSAVLTDNPCIGRTGVRLTLEEGSTVEARLFDFFGRLVTATSSGTILPRGEHLIPMDMKTGAGDPLPAGVYILELRACGGRTSIGLTVLGEVP